MSSLEYQNVQHYIKTNLVGTRGFEPPTPSTPYWCASQTAPRPARLYSRLIELNSKEFAYTRSSISGLNLRLISFLTDSSGLKVLYTIS